jgi:O-antigen ligase
MVHTVLFSFSRGGMSALIVVGVLSFLLIPKQPKHYVIFLLAVLLGLRLAGPEVRNRFMSSFLPEEQLDSSAKSRLELWADCLESIRNRPVLGLGPDHWPLVAEEHGWLAGKHAHSLWFQIGTELGLPGLFFLLLFYGLCSARLCTLVPELQIVGDPFIRACARMVIASLIGFMVAAQFVTLPGLEVPYYVVLLGAGALKLSPGPNTVPTTASFYPAVAEATSPILASL